MQNRKGENVRRNKWKNKKIEEECDRFVRAERKEGNVRRSRKIRRVVAKRRR
jgi:hypothetical protein